MAILGLIVLFYVGLVVANLVTAVFCFLRAKRGSIPDGLRMFSNFILLLDIPAWLLFLAPMLGGDDELPGTPDAGRIFVFSLIVLIPALFLLAASRFSPPSPPGGS